MNALLNPCQQEVVDRGFLTSGFSAVLQMPTGAGKTWLAELAIENALRLGQRAIYLTPLRALANELIVRWKSRFPGAEVGVFTGEYGQKQSYPVPFERAQLLIMTPNGLTPARDTGDLIGVGFRKSAFWSSMSCTCSVSEEGVLGWKGR